MQVEMKHRLPRRLAAVGADEDAGGVERRRLRLGDTLRHLHQMGEHVRRNIHQIAVMPGRDHQQVAGRQRMDVHEGEHLAVLIDLHRLQPPVEDLGEGIVGIMAVESRRRIGRGARRDRRRRRDGREQRQRGERRADHRVGAGSSPE